MESAGRRNTGWLDRIGMLIGAVLILVGTRLPLWGMTLIAPQYPEGLRVTIFANRMEGDLDIINTLNHYVGMRDLDGMSFPELQYMTYVLGFIALLFLIDALWPRLWDVGATLVVAAGVGAVGLYDLYHKLYQYGHDLDPKAPIKLSGGFTPPVIGQNQLANFHTSSYFLTGSYLVMLGGAIGVLILWHLAKRRRSSAQLV